MYKIVWKEIRYDKKFYRRLAQGFPDCQILICQFNFVDSAWIDYHTISNYAALFTVGNHDAEFENREL